MWGSIWDPRAALYSKKHSSIVSKSCSNGTSRRRSRIHCVKAGKPWNFPTDSFFFLKFTFGPKFFFLRPLCERSQSSWSKPLEICSDSLVDKKSVTCTPGKKIPSSECLWSSQQLIDDQPLNILLHFRQKTNESSFWNKNYWIPINATRQRASFTWYSSKKFLGVLLISFSQSKHVLFPLQSQGFSLTRCSIFWFVLLENFDVHSKSTFYDLFTFCKMMNPYDYHKYLINEYILNKPGSTKLMRNDESKWKSDKNVIFENMKFVWNEGEKSLRNFFSFVNICLHQMHHRNSGKRNWQRNIMTSFSKSIAWVFLNTCLGSSSN